MIDLRLNIKRFLTEETKTKIRNEDYLLNRYITIKNDNEDDFVINKDNYLKSVVIDNSRYVPKVGVIGGFVAREVTITLLNFPVDTNIKDKKFIIKVGFFICSVQFLVVPVYPLLFCA